MGKTITVTKDVPLLLENDAEHGLVIVDQRDVDSEFAIALDELAGLLVGVAGGEAEGVFAEESARRGFVVAGSIVGKIGRIVEVASRIALDDRRRKRLGSGARLP